MIMKTWLSIAALVVLALGAHSDETVAKRGWFDSLQDLTKKVHSAIHGDSPSSYNLTYFNARGRAEVIRVLFVLANQTFEDTRIELVDWPKWKPTFPLGQVPQLDVTVNGKLVQLVQSMSIARYLGREFDLDGSTSLEKAIVDVFCGTATDLFNAAGRAAFTTDPTAKAVEIEKTKDFIKGTNKLLAMHRKGTWILGDEPSLADAAVYATADFVLSETPLTGDVADIHKKFSEIPSIANWRRTSPQTSPLGN